MYFQLIFSILVPAGPSCPGPHRWAPLVFPDSAVLIFHHTLCAPKSRGFAAVAPFWHPVQFLPKHKADWKLTIVKADRF